jgi:hypothetical protein
VGSNEEEISMTNSKNDIEELASLQREAAELRAERKRARSTAKPAAERKSRTTDERNATKTPPVEDAAGEGESLEAEKTAQDVADQWESVVQKIEEAARERPVLALLAAFATGVVVGHVLTRR